MVTEVTTDSLDRVLILVAEAREAKVGFLVTAACSEPVDAPSCRVPLLQEQCLGWLV